MTGTQKIMIYSAVLKLIMLFSIRYYGITAGIYLGTFWGKTPPNFGNPPNFRSLYDGFLTPDSCLDAVLTQYF